MHAELDRKSNELRDELDRRRDLRRTLGELEDPEEEEGRTKRIIEADAAHAEATRHHAALERAIEVERAARVESERASERLELLDRNLAETREARAALDIAKEEVAATMAAKVAAESKVAELEQAHESALAHAETARKTLQGAMRAAASASVEERRREVNDQIGRAEGYRRQAEQALADAKSEVSERVLAGLESLDEELRVLKRTREIEAASITMEYVPDRQDGISLDGAPLADGERTPIPDGVLLEIEGLGRLTIHPGQGADRESLSEADEKLTSALAEVGIESVEAARASGRRRLDAEEHARDATATLSGIAPAGIESLREQLATLPEPVEKQDDLPTVGEAQDSDAAARGALDAASRRLDSARVELQTADALAARAAARVEGAEGRLARSKAVLASIEDPEIERDSLRRTVSELGTAYAGAMRSREEMAAKAPDIEATEVRLTRARAIVSQAEEEMKGVRLELGKLDTAIEIHAGEAVEEELSDVTVRLEAADAALDELDFEVAVLQKLNSALDGARQSARDRYVEPVLNELKPLLELLWPEAELRFDADAVLPATLERGGTEENFDVLSGGTQEQIALLVRLAFARMLARAGSPAPVILDDGIVYTDDDRIERMFDALTRQAQDLQIIVFSCRQRAFRDLGGHALAIVPVAQEL